MEPRGGREAAGYLIAGRVQGVGFRRWTVKRAQALDVAGSVRNMSDGTVEVMAVGAPGAVEQMRQDLARGPRFARVDGIAEIPCSLDPAAVGFSIL